MPVSHELKPHMWTNANTTLLGSLEAINKLQRIIQLGCNHQKTYNRLYNQTKRIRKTIKDYTIRQQALTNLHMIDYTIKQRICILARRIIRDIAKYLLRMPMDGWYSQQIIHHIVVKIYSHNYEILSRYNS